MADYKVPPRGSCVDCARPSPGKPQCVSCYRKRLGRDATQRTRPLAESMSYPPQYQPPQIIHHYAPMPVYPGTHVARSVPVAQPVQVAPKRTTQLQESADGITWRNVDRVNETTTTQVRLVQYNADGSETILQVRGAPAPVAPVAVAPVVTVPVVAEASIQPTTQSVMEQNEQESVQKDRFMLIELD
jgi:hypothetical protein